MASVQEVASALLRTCKSFLSEPLTRKVGGTAHSMSAPAPAENARQSRRGSSIEGGLRIKGQISGNEDLLVDGTVDGPIALEAGTLTVREKGRVTGDISAREVVVHGRVTGNLDASHEIAIKANGSVVGDVSTLRIAIDDGAQFKGTIEIDSKK